MFVILFGAPGAGKGTQSKLIAEKYNIPHISTGDIFRSLATKNTETAIKVKQIVDSGGYVNDELTCQIVQERLEESDCQNGWLLDGFPRNIKQADYLTELLGQNISKMKCILLEVPDSISIARIIKRAETSGRNDDNRETAEKRLKIYQEQTEPLVNYYLSKNILEKVNGNNEISMVFDEIKRILTK